MKKNKLVMPILKWVGGKRQLLNEITEMMPKRIVSYCEPFVGGGAVLFYLQPKKAIVNDLNSELINVYNVIMDDIEELIIDLQKHNNESDYFYQVRDLDRDKNLYVELSNVEKASRMIFLNKTCYNGLFRVNRSGEFNTPFGRYKNPNIVNEPVLRALNKYFQKSEICFSSKDYFEVLSNIPKNTFVYLDPPYDPVSGTANFTGYNKGGFDRDEQIRLRDACNYLNDNGIKFLLSNSATDFIKELYVDYDINVVKAKRVINSVASKRGEIEEVLIKNYG
ncbi:DNA adenine methylase [Methanoplanus endosymbiosus]|uniref:site-specific DNA-methyltransferase (adenine-specific) n=1 Tax=Methanoplanus endosymbiosus TaxID=33865 RepID=A0A9E7PPA5_9EURY|nr:DNA adenine methylase [Methanoplanus endosymbiosus]UUX91147.1 DNA adenine methylase [Methanoplanus endosymbiosus]